MVPLAARRTAGEAQGEGEGEGDDSDDEAGNASAIQVLMRMRNLMRLIAQASSESPCDLKFLFKLHALCGPCSEGPVAGGCFLTYETAM